MPDTDEGCIEMVENSIVLNEKWYVWILKRKKTFVANAIIDLAWLWFTLSLYMEYPNGRISVIWGMLIVFLGLFLLAWGKPLYKIFSSAKYELIIKKESDDDGLLIVIKNGEEKFRITRGNFVGCEFIRQLNQLLGTKIECYTDNDKLHKKKYILNFAFVPDDETVLVGPFISKFYSLR